MQRLMPPTKPKYTVAEAEAAYKTNNTLAEALFILFMEVDVTSGSIMIWRLSKHLEASWLLYNTSGLWPRVRARALRAPVFLSSLTCKSGRPPPLAYRSFAAPVFITLSVY